MLFCFAMPCSECHEWIEGEWIVWRRYDRLETWQIQRGYSTSQWHDMAWFFFCSKCKVRKSSLRGWYINADGNVSTDSESSTYKRSAEPNWSAGRWSDPRQHGGNRGGVDPAQRDAGAAAAGQPDLLVVSKTCLKRVRKAQLAMYKFKNCFLPEFNKFKTAGLSHDKLCFALRNFQRAQQRSVAAALPSQSSSQTSAASQAMAMSAPPTPVLAPHAPEPVGSPIQDPPTPTMSPPSFSSCFNGDEPPPRHGTGTIDTSDLRSLP